MVFERIRYTDEELLRIAKMDNREKKEIMIDTMNSAERERMIDVYFGLK